jgi:hypothetical protein
MGLRKLDEENDDRKNRKRRERKGEGKVKVKGERTAGAATHVTYSTNTATTFASSAPGFGYSGSHTTTHVAQNPPTDSRADRDQV